MIQRHIGLLLTVVFLVAAPACAPAYSYRGDRDRDYRVDSQRRAYANGQNAGLKDGRNDARRGRRAGYEQHDTYRDANRGYDRREGDRDDYREAFRKGFIAGYNDAFRANERDIDRRSRRR